MHPNSTVLLHSRSSGSFPEYGKHERARAGDIEEFGREKADGQQTVRFHAIRRA